MTKKSPSKRDTEPGSKANSLATQALWRVLKELPTDFEPYRKRERNGILDCSCNCRWFYKLAGKKGEDWGICANRTSPRVGLLTFEHQGCAGYEWDPRGN